MYFIYFIVYTTVSFISVCQNLTKQFISYNLHSFIQLDIFNFWYAFVSFFCLLYVRKNLHTVKTLMGKAYTRTSELHQYSTCGNI